VPARPDAPWISGSCLVGRMRGRSIPGWMDGPVIGKVVETGRGRNEDNNLAAFKTEDEGIVTDCRNGYELDIW